ncbi:hypothetical protein OBBRIDRAFT_884726 [Obba rivulosa]|uniref:Uncharacterized protein n=1 Tax=Obba rivulosa TaxID=1052685 RepID=A0A8E2J6R7_9APHY|nr:hypothetical protein OBBRIDRAFT_884726 [Obba rivulosa]
MDDSDSSPSPLDVSPRTRKGGEPPRRSHRSSKLAGSTRELARLLLSQERDTTDLRQMLANVTQLLKGERQRADAAETRAKEVAMRVRALNDAKLVAEQEAQRTREELGLYKLQLEAAQREIHRAQELVDTLETQRLDAEAAAARARTTARKLKEERLIQLAREEGYRQGLEEGINQGRSVGYEEGRAEGFERRTHVAQQAYTDEMQDPDPSTSNEDNERNYAPSRRSVPSSSSSTSTRRIPDYTQPLDQSLPFLRPVTTPARIPTPAAANVEDQEIHPIIVHNAPPSPSHPHIEYPPDNWIPTLDDDGRIRLPPPHEVAPPPPSPSPPPSVVLQSVTRRPETQPPLMVPSPDTRKAASAVSDTESVTAPTQPRPRHARRGSNESQSTTWSQFEMLQADPRDRASKLSAIAEERERSSSMSPPDYRSPSQQSGLQITLDGPPSHVPAIHIGWSGDAPGNPNLYVRPRRSDVSLSSGQRLEPPRSTSRATSRSSSRTGRGSPIGITVEPPSRSESNPSSRSASTSPRDELLSAADAANAPPLDQDIGVGTVSEAGGQPVIPSTVPILPDGQLPPGFVPIGPPIQGYPTPQMGAQTLGSMSPAGTYTNPMTPAAVPLPPSSYAGPPSVVNLGMPGAFPGPGGMHVTAQTVHTPGFTPNVPQPAYGRPKRDSSDSDSDNSLTTPPARRINLGAQGTPSYAEAPLPPGVMYPAPPRPPSTTSSRGTRAAGVPLPPSTSGSATSPGSSVMYQSMHATQSRGSLPLDGRNRPLSPIMGSPYHMPLTMPEPPPVPQMDRFYGAQNEPVIPIPGMSRPPSVPKSSRAGSDTSSQISFSGASGASRSKRKKKAKSRIASVEELPDEE